MGIPMFWWRQKYLLEWIQHEKPLGFSLLINLKGFLFSNLNLEFVFQGKRATRTCSSEPLRPRHTRLVHKFNTASLGDNIMRSIFKTYLIISTKFPLWHRNLLISQHCQLCGKSEVKTKVKDGLSSFFGCLLTGRQSISENTGGGTFAWLRVLY